MALEFVVEDGTGLEDATSYADIAEADQYFENVADTDWTGTDDVKKAALNEGARYIDATWGAKMKGFP